MNHKKIYDKLIKLLKLFNNRPHHLAKYLLDNSAFNKEFIEHLINSNKISNLSDIDIEKIKNFKSISEMEDFYSSLIIEGKSKKEIENELNLKLNNLLTLEKYEEAAKVRDYMKRNGFKRI